VARVNDELPAAHSMDTTWYSVDEHGHVGVFETGEDGALPIAAAIGASPGDANFDVELLAVARLGTTLEDGFFHFGRDHGDDPGRYVCSDPPEHPVHVDALTPELAAAMARLRLPVDFRSGQPVHLADHEDVHAETWGDLPLRYTEQWHEQQQARVARGTEREQAAGGRAVVVLLAALLVLIGWLVSR
jgi:hypothetical protein